MQELSLDEPIDILADAPAEISEGFPEPIEVSAEKDGLEESKKTQEIVSRKYTNEDVYKMISLVLHYPSGGHGGETFWSWMVKIYGKTLLNKRNGSGLRNRWRKIIKEHPYDLNEYKKQLAATLSLSFIENVERKITQAIADISKLNLSNKAYASLFPGFTRPTDTKDPDKLTSKRKLENGHAESLINKERRKVKKNGFKDGIDINLLVNKTPISLFKPNEEVDVIGIEARIALGKQLVVIKDFKENTTTVKVINAGFLPGELQVCNKPEVKECDLLRNITGKISLNKEWNELEDKVLELPANGDLINCLIKMRGVEEVEKRKKFLGLI